MDELTKARHAHVTAEIDLVSMTEKYDNLVEIAIFLLELKKHKDAKGKDMFYRVSMPIAWRKLEKELS